jgi:hypothetical protein
MAEARRFPPPWSIEELEACFVVRDNSGQALAYVYFEAQGRRSGRRFATSLPDSLNSAAISATYR